MLKTRHREHIFVDASINAKQPFVIDNTNSTKTDRQKYMDAARSQQFKVTGYYFEPNLEESMARNDKRSQGKVPLPGLRSTLRKLQKPDFDEGFDQLYSVRIVDGVFTVSEWT
ncbi:AAA family ATPase [Paenibacillus sepulcri]